MIVQEAQKLRTEVLETGKDDSEKINPEEVDADKLADSIEQDINWISALKIKEAKLNKRLEEVRRAKAHIRKRLTKRL
jgi:hypothetical protein